MNQPTLNRIHKQIKRCEVLYEKKSTIRRAFLLSLRYFVSYRITGDKSLLHKANYVSQTSLEKNPWHFESYFFSIFMLIEIGEMERAQSKLDAVKNYKNSFKKNNPKLYLQYMYCGLKLITSSKQNKLFKELDDFEKECIDDSVLYKICFLRTALQNDNEIAYFNKYLSYNYIPSPLFYIYLGDILTNITVSLKYPDICAAEFMLWAVAHSYEAQRIVEKWDVCIAEQLQLTPSYAVKVYDKYPRNIILQAICTVYMKNRNFSSEAFRYYKEAELKQMLLPKLSEFLVCAAYINSIEDLSRFCLDQFFSLNHVEQEIKPFLYHILLTNKKNVDLCKRYAQEITQFGIFALENKLKGRYYYSIYKFLLDTEADNMPNLIDVKLIETLLQSNLFLYEVTVESEKASEIFVFEKEKIEKTAFPITDGKAIVKASSDNFSYFLLNKGRRQIIDDKIRVRRIIENADVKLYMRFFEKGMNSPELLIALSKYYIGLEKPTERCLDTLTRTVTNNSVSQKFKMQVSATLGNYYSYGKDYEKAVSYYKVVDENLLDDKHIEQILIVYVNAREFQKAVNLINKKAECISDRILFYALKQISQHGKFDRHIADVAYELILKSWYDKALIEIVLKHYKGSQEEWQELSRALSAMNVTERSLDEIILSNSIWMHKIDKGTQKIFSRMYEFDMENSLIEQFSLYLAYEMLINDMKPEYETLAILERMFLNSNSFKLACALSHVYVNFNITTFHSEEILSRAAVECEKNGVLFPFFKQIKDKSMLTPYIEKNQPFIYRSLPGRTVILYYRIDGTTDTYRCKTMKYFGFGMYLTHVVHFFGETIYYYFSEEMPSGSIESKEQMVENKKIHMLDTNDSYYKINNALVYEQMFKYENVEEIITDRLKEFPHVKGWIM